VLDLFGSAVISAEGFFVAASAAMGDSVSVLPGVEVSCALTVFEGAGRGCSDATGDWSTAEGWFSFAFTSAFGASEAVVVVPSADEVAGAAASG
jgi:hypothetical protein